MDLNAAAREALLEMIDHLERAYGFARPAAYALCSAVVDLRLSEVVDVPTRSCRRCSRSTSSKTLASS